MIMRGPSRRHGGFRAYCPRRSAYVHIAHPTWSFMAPRVSEPRRGEERMSLEAAMRAEAANSRISEVVVALGPHWECGADLREEDKTAGGWLPFGFRVLDTIFEKCRGPYWI
jgi:hypothetical protein